MNKIKIQEDIIRNNKANKDITLVHIADIHFSRITKEKKLQALVREILKIKPDYVLITGDLIDDASIINNKYKIKELLNFLTDIAREVRVLISLGNHDIFMEKDYKFFKKINELNNIYVLDNSFYKDDSIYVVGLTLPNKYYYNIIGDESAVVLLNQLSEYRKLINKMPEELPKILMIHSPIKVMEWEVINKLKEFDLILSGHTHGGMMPTLLGKIFRGNYGIIAPNKQLFPPVARGRIDKCVNNKQVSLIINSGITKLSLKSTIFLSKFNFVYDIGINKIIITKKRGRY